MAVAPTGNDGIMVHAYCYLVINGKEGHSIHASFFGGAEKYLQRGSIVRGFNNIQGEATARVRAARMVAALPEATIPTLPPQHGFSNVYGGNMADAEQALKSRRKNIWSLSTPLVATGWNR
jgi:hypothetical protein